MTIAPALKSNEIHIALGFDNNYIVHIYPMLTSVFLNNKNNNIFLHAIATGINDDDKIKLIRFAKINNAEFFFYELNQEILKENVIIPEESYFTAATFYRLFFSSLLGSEVKRLLYLDPDIIVLGDLKNLYNTNMTEKIIAAVADPGMGSREDLGLPPNCKYFNAGVMLIDLERWRDENVSDNAFKFVKSYPGDLVYLDQDALNATLQDKWLEISNKYNFTTFEVKLQVPVKELIKDVLIVHFTSSKKPWNALTRNKFRYLYQYYLRLSPEAHTKRYTDFKWDIKSLWTFVRIRLKEFYFNYGLHKNIPVNKWMKDSWDY